MKFRMLIKISSQANQETRAGAFMPLSLLRSSVSNPLLCREFRPQVLLNCWELWRLWLETAANLTGNAAHVKLPVLNLPDPASIHVVHQIEAFTLFTLFALVPLSIQGSLVLWYGPWTCWLSTFSLDFHCFWDSQILDRNPSVVLISSLCLNG